MIDTDKIEYHKVIRLLLKIAKKKDRRVKFLTYKQYRELFKGGSEAFSEYGFVFGARELSVIVLNERQLPHQKIFTMAHEIAHLVLGHLTHNRELCPESSEWEANLFASMIMFALNGAIPYMEHYDGKTRKEVDAKLTVAKAERDKGTYIEPSKMTVGECDIWLKDYKKNSLKMRSYYRYCSVVKNHINPKLGGYKLKDIRNDMIQRFINDLSNNGMAASSVQFSQNILHASFEQALTNNLISNNVAKKIQLPKRPTTEIKVLSLEEQIKFIQAARYTYHGEFFILALATGMRSGDV